MFCVCLVAPGGPAQFPSSSRSAHCLLSGNVGGFILCPPLVSHDVSTYFDLSLVDPQRVVFVLWSLLVSHIVSIHIRCCPITSCVRPDFTAYIPQCLLLILIFRLVYDSIFVCLTSTAGLL